MTDEEVPLAAVFREALGFLRGRKDIALFGAQAVNAYCATERMTHDLDLLATDAVAVAEAMRAHLAATFHIAARVREVVPGGFRIYQLRQPKNPGRTHLNSSFLRTASARIQISVEPESEPRAAGPESEPGFQIGLGLARGLGLEGRSDFDAYALPKNRHLVDIRQVSALPRCSEIGGVQVVAPADLIAMKIASASARRRQPKGDTDLADVKRLLLEHPTLQSGTTVLDALKATGASEAACTLWQEIVQQRIEPDQDEGY